MAFYLRPYQIECINALRAALRKHQSVLLRLPTGGGKTALSAFMAGTVASRGGRVVFGVHRRELIRQTTETFDSVGIPYGVIASGYRSNFNEKVQIASIPTLVRRLDLYPIPDIYIPDEAHHTTATTWAKVHNYYREGKTKIVGLTATPQRLDGEGLQDWFDHIVHGPEISWLIENSYLSPYRLFAPSIPDLSGLANSGGDYNRTTLAERMSGTRITGDVVSHYKRFAMGKRTIIFCVSIKHSQSVVAEFRQAGIKAEHIDGDSPNRDQLINDFRLGKITVLSSVDLISEGFDLPSIECAILLRPTRSLSLYLQQVGRALRLSEGKTEAIILDHAGNSIPLSQGGRGHGLPCENREWTLEGRKKKKGNIYDKGEKVSVRQCPKCYRVHLSQPYCPTCGHEYEIASREIKQEDGELVEVSRQQKIRESRIEQASAQTLEELVELGRKKKYKNPYAWAKHVMNARHKKKFSKTGMFA
ncbi:DEAD/DEAH box helicase [Bartonella sp. B17]